MKQEQGLTRQGSDQPCIELNFGYGIYATSMKVSRYASSMVCLFLGRVNIDSKPDFHLSNGFPGEGAIFLPPADDSARPALFLAAENAILHFLFDLFSLRMQYCTFYMVYFL